MLVVALLAAAGGACDSARNPASSPPSSTRAAVPAPIRRGVDDPVDPRPDPRVAVLVELFSSEGCSSCPPADDTLRALDEEQPIDGAIVIPLEMHVDYWNDLGWADPFSSPAFSARQRSYASAGGRSGVFTPEALVDGQASIVGSDREGLTDLVHAASRRRHASLRVEIAGDKAHVTVGSDVPKSASLWFALTELGLETRVAAGENRGRTLRHAPVVRRLERIGEATPGAIDIDFSSDRGAGGHTRAVVFLQSPSDGSIIGAATAER